MGWVQKGEKRFDVRTLKKDHPDLQWDKCCTADGWDETFEEYPFERRYYYQGSLLDASGEIVMAVEIWRNRERTDWLVYTGQARVAQHSDGAVGYFRFAGEGVPYSQWTEERKAMREATKLLIGEAQATAS